MDRRIDGSGAGARAPVARAASLGAAVLSGVALAGCDAVLVEAAARRLEVPAGLDLGRVAVGHPVEVELPLRSVGAQPVTVDAIRVPDGLPVEVLPFTPAIAVGDQRVVTLRLTPEREGRIDRELVVVSDAERPEQAVRVQAEVLPEALELSPDPLDFGWVRIGDDRTLAVALTNRLSRPVEVTAALDPAGRLALSGASGVFFAVEGLDAEGRLEGGPIAPGATGRLRIGFSPDRIGEVRARLPLRTCPRDRCSTPLDLAGTGVETGLRCTPPALDFGFVRPDGERRLSVTCENPTHRPLLLDRPAVVGLDRSRFSVLFAPSSLAPGASGEVELALAPQAEDRGRALEAALQVEARSGFPGIERLQVILRARVARAELVARPARLFFGRVAVGLEAIEAVVLANTGDRPVAVSGIGATPPFVVESRALTLAAGEQLLVPVSLVAPQAGPLTGALEVEVDDAEVASVEIPLGADALDLPPCRLEVAPDPLAFGLVDVQRSSTRTVLLRNLADAPCLVRDPEATGDGFSAVPLDGPDLIVPGRGRARLDVVFAPPAAGQFDGRLRFAVSDPARPVREVRLAGVAGQDRLVVDPARLDFGFVRPSCGSRARSLRILNQGSASVDVRTLFSSRSEFALEQLPAGFPAPPGDGQELAGGELWTVQVRFRPTRPGPADPAEVVVDRAGMSAPRRVSLVGAGLEDDAVEVFRQAAASAVDVLFVIDNSLSMAQEQANVVANADRFLGRLTQVGADYRVGVVSTDMAHPACARPTRQRPFDAPVGACGFLADAGRADWRVIDPADQPSPAGAFAQVLQLGLGGSAVEAGLSAAERALSPLALSGHNAGLRRPGAHLAVIFVSDEEDQSPGRPEAYVPALRQATAAPDEASVSAILTTGARCGLETGSRYRAVVDEVGGIVRSICAGDWSAVMSDLALRAAGLRRRFRLAGDPEPGSLEVRVDGRSVPSGASAGRGFDFDPEARAVVFGADEVPPEGARIEVRYRPACP